MYIHLNIHNGDEMKHNKDMDDSLTTAKNQLQELFQKKQLPLPKYDTVRSGGADHEPLWISTVTLYNGQKFSGDIYSNKSKADASAALKALRTLIGVSKQTSYKPGPVRVPPIVPNTMISVPLGQIPPIVPSKIISVSPGQVAPILPIVSPLVTDLVTRVDKISVSTNTGKTALLVDVENLPKFIDESISRLNEFTVYAFVGEHHHSVDKEFPEGVIKILSPSTRADGTDTCMQVYIGMLLAREAYDNYLIATRDHYGSALVEMIMCPNLGWLNKSARLVTKSSQL